MKADRKSEMSSYGTESRRAMVRGDSKYWVIALLAAASEALAASATSPDHLKKLSIEELLDVEVTLVSRSAESLRSSPAAIAVVSGEDIRRSGATSIPEALRGVPGIFVGQSNSSTWALSARGFNSVNSEKLLVLADTRSIYTPLHSGVYWDVQDYFLHDIAQIEVVRGPGAALWGSNAVNGVVNIISKHSRDTQGLYAEAGSGDEQKVIAGARYGMPLGERGSMRIYGKYSERDGTYHPGSQSDDDWNIGHVGLRADWELSDTDDLMLSAAAYDGEVGLVAPSIEVIGRPGPTGELRADVRGGHVLGRWIRRVDEHTRWRTRIYYDRTRRDDPSYIDELDTVDLDVQYGTRLGMRHDVLLGLNYRHTDNRNLGGGIFALQPASSKDEVISGFVQDQITLSDALRLTIGTKLEHNDFSGSEVQPSLRLAWDVHSSMMLWTSVSRAARVPTRLERDIAVDALDPSSNPRAILIGNKDLDSEEMIGYEAGLRWQPNDMLFGDFAVFYNDYDGLMSLEFDEPYIDPNDGRVIIPIRNRNLTNGHSHGLEALVTYAPVSWWRLTASYAFLDLTLDPRGQDINRGGFYDGATPRHQAGLRSQMDISNNVKLDVDYRYVTDIERTPEDPSGAGIDGYSELDLRVAWRASPSIELSLVGQNLLHARHIEAGSPQARGAIERSVYAKVTWGW